MQEKYGFYGRLKSEFPSQIIIDVAEDCNLACIHCPHADFKKSGVYTGSFLDRELVHKMAEEVLNYGQGIVQQIRYTANGEPLLHSDIMQILYDTKKISKQFVSLTTNGTLLSEDKARDLLDTNIDMVDISIDAFYDQTYKQIRRGNLHVTRGNTERLIDLKKKLNKNTKVVVSFVEQEFNKDEVTLFKEYWEKQGADYVIIRKLHSAAGAKKGVVGPKVSNRQPCVYPWERILLNPKGKLEFCPTSWLGYADIVDYRDTTIKEVWKGEFYNDLREAHLVGNLKNYKACNGCTDCELTSWPGEGRGYGDLIQEFKGSTEENN